MRRFGVAAPARPVFHGPPCSVEAAISDPVIHPVILCGGSGTRLWPSSRAAFPKQFAPLLGTGSLYQATLRRFATGGKEATGAGLAFAAPLVMTHTDFRFLAAEQAACLGLADARIVLEPAARNTAPAILAAALLIAAGPSADAGPNAGPDAGPDALMLVAPSDHLIADPAAFRAALRAGIPAAEAGRLVTFGIAPDRAETGYGWLECDASAAVADLVRFVEKPDAAAAAAMLGSGRHLWNAGIFLARVRDMLAAFDTHAPEFGPFVRAAIAAARGDLGFLRLGAAYADAPSVSIDYAVMERAAAVSGAVSVVPTRAGWSDLGAWDALWAASPRDGDGVALAGEATAIGCRDTLLRSEVPGLRLVGLGLDGVVAVAMRDAVLVAGMGAAQSVRDVVAALKADGVAQAEEYPRFHRPWGWYETLCLGTRFQVKRIMVHPGGVLSLQSHMHRAEHWVVVAGTARITVGEGARGEGARGDGAGGGGAGGRVELLTENQSVYIPLGTVHRMENPGRVPMYLIEVQTGSYLGEDDIVRLEDAYDRS